MAEGERPPNADSQVIKGELLDMRALPLGLLTKLLASDELPMLKAEYLRVHGKHGRPVSPRDIYSSRQDYAEAEEGAWHNPLTGIPWGGMGHFRDGQRARTSPHFDDDVTTIGMSKDGSMNRSGLFNEGACVDGRQEKPGESGPYPWGTTDPIPEPKVFDELLARLKNTLPQE